MTVLIRAPVLAAQRPASAAGRATPDTLGILEVHHRDRNRTNNAYTNLALVHGHCHDLIHAGASYLWTKTR
ncbi:MAG: HNH endonuclease [Chloroflexi bacterium]|nr:HNH endonuclease [Chloroflexota bacterium]